MTSGRGMVVNSGRIIVNRLACVIPFCCLKGRVCIFEIVSKIMLMFIPSRLKVVLHNN